MVETALSIKAAFDLISATGVEGEGFASSPSFVSFCSSVGLVSSAFISTSAMVGALGEVEGDASSTFARGWPCS